MNIYVVNLKKVKHINKIVPDRLTTISEYVVKSIAKEVYSLSEDEIIIQREENGKPYFVNLNNLFFNVTHSGNFLFVVFSKDNIGIDAEIIRKVKFTHSQKFFTEKENKYIFSKKTGIYRRFLTIWTKKEAHSKFLGLGILKYLKQNISTPPFCYTIKYKKCIISIVCKTRIESHKIISAKKYIKNS